MGCCALAHGCHFSQACHEMLGINYRSSGNGNNASWAGLFLHIGYSPPSQTLALSNCRLFGKPKESPRGDHYANVKRGVQTWIQQTPAAFFKRGIMNLTPRWQSVVLVKKTMLKVRYSGGRTNTLGEVCASMGKLKNGSSPGSDGITKELLKYSALITAPLLVRLFVSVWRTGRVPAEWRDGNRIIVSIYKGKGARTECESHRTITYFLSLKKSLPTSCWRA